MSFCLIDVIGDVFLLVVCLLYMACGMRTQNYKPEHVEMLPIQEISDSLPFPEPSRGALPDICPTKYNRAATGYLHENTVCIDETFGIYQNTRGVKVQCFSSQLDEAVIA